MAASLGYTPYLVAEIVIEDPFFYPAILRCRVLCREPVADHDEIKIALAPDRPSKNDYEFAKIHGWKPGG